MSEKVEAASFAYVLEHNANQHTVFYGPSGDVAMSGRITYIVACLSCGVLVHPSTTNPVHQVASHEETKASWGPLEQKHLGVITKALEAAKLRLPEAKL